MPSRAYVRFPLLALAFLSLLAAMWAGLLRLGWALPRLTFALAADHGLLMIAGFLGALISLERAAALEFRWTFAAPLLFGLGVLATLGGFSEFVAPLLMTLGSLIMIAIYVLLVGYQRALHTLIMLVGALCLLVGNSLWLAGRNTYDVVMWWAAFPVLTIVGERLELSRLRQIAPRLRLLLLALVTVHVLGLVSITLNLPAWGTRLAGAGLLGQGLWLLRYDIARRSLSQGGLPRFMAVCLLLGQVWLVVGGGLLIAYGRLMAGPSYDAILHSLMLGFVFSMIFAHAPIILPSVLKLTMSFHTAFYAHVVLLQASLLIRLAGDLFGALSLRQWGGMLNALAILLFLANTMRAILTKTPEVGHAPGPL